MNRALRVLLFSLLACLLACAPPGGLVGGPGTNPILWPSWQVAAWWIDPVSGSDSNAGTSSGTPLKTWHQLHDVIWHCQGNPQGCPRLGSTIGGDASASPTVTVTFLSSQADSSDPVYVSPFLENGVSLVLQGNLGAAQQVATGTLNAVTAKNRATPQALASTFTITAPDGGAAPTLLPGELIVNATHASRAWINAVGSPNTITQPLAPSGLTSNSPAEVNTWATADAITIYQPVAVNVAYVGGAVADTNTTNFFSGVFLYQLATLDPYAGTLGNLNPMTVTGNVGPYVIESSLGRSMSVESGANSLLAPQVNLANVDVNTAIVMSGYGKSGILVSAGQVRNSTAGASFMRGALVTNDTILSVSGTVDGATLGFVEIPSTVTLTVTGNSAMTSSGILWGAGTVNVAGAGRLAYPAGAGKAAIAFTTTGLQINGQTKYLTQLPTSASGIVTGNTSLTAAALDTSGGATTMCALGAGASICNVP